MATNSMNNKLIPAVFNWSGGKDSALALHKINEENQFDVRYLLTSVSERHRRISMHGVRVELLNAQVSSIGLPLIQMVMPDQPDMETYERTMFQSNHDLKKAGVEAAIFGDIFLEDLKAYREAQLARIPLAGAFPLWKLPTRELLHEFIDLGFKAIIVCVNEKYLDKSFAGRLLDHHFIKDLPAQVDPCGENGEFHTFVFDGPIFQKPINFSTGELVYRKYERDVSSASENNPWNTGFWFLDLLPV